MGEEIRKYDERGNLIYLEYPHIGYRYYQEFDKKNRLIYAKDNIILKGYPEASYYKYKDNIRIEISKQEFEQIKKEKIRKLINNSKISRFELMDI